MSFSDFIAPVGVGDFLAGYSGKQPLHISGEGRAPLDILNWRRFNQVLAITPYWTEDSLKLYFKSRAALRDSYCDAADGRGRSAPVNPAKVKALIALGASLVANHIHRICPEIASVARMLEDQFAARVFSNVYCSFQGVQAFQTHYDLHDVFAFQAEGEKVWRVYEARADAPIAPVPPGDEAEQWLIQSRGRVLFEAHMKPGDLLYLPRGQYHDALTGSQASLHVTFGVSPATGLAVFKLLESVLASDSAFRAYLPDARDGAALGDRLSALAEKISAQLVSPVFAIDVHNHQRGLRSPSVDYDLPVQKKSVWFAVAKSAQVVRRQQGYVLSVEREEIELGHLAPTIEWALKQRSFSLEDAAARQSGVDMAALRSILERLIGAGVIVETAMQ